MTQDDILEAVKAGRFVMIMTPIRSDYRGSTAEIMVSADALKIDGVRVAVSARTQQHVADVLDLRLPTPRICDLAWEQSEVRVKPQLGKPDAHMADWSRIVEHSRKIDAALPKGAKDYQLTRNVGKDWVLSKRILERKGAAANYGWFDAKAGHLSHSGMKLWQPLGTAHNVDHYDYSQTATFIGPEIRLRNVDKWLTFEECAASAEYAGHLSDEGIMRVTRYAV